MNKDNKRIIEIYDQLCKLSKDGWANARPCDYEPLERELRQLLARRKVEHGKA